MIHLDKLVSIEVLFTCSICDKWVKKRVRLKADLELDLSDLPENWVVSTDTNYFRAYCPEHTMRAK